METEANASMRGFGHVVMLGCSVILTGCGSNGNDGSGVASTGNRSFITRDSAGVEIAESLEPAWRHRGGWYVESNPFLEIGREEGESADVFGSVRNAIRLRDGNIAVAETQSRQIRIFSAAGATVRVLGGRGVGPGQFAGPIHLGVIRGDSLMVWDYTGHRTTVFSSTGTVARVIDGPPAIWEGLYGMYAIGWMDDGAFVAGNSVQPSEFPPDRGIAYSEWHLFDASGVHERLLARLPSVLTDNRGTFPHQVALGPLRHAVTDESSMWHGFPETYELRRIRRDGSEWVLRRLGSSREAIPEILKRLAREQIMRRARSLGTVPPRMAERARLMAQEQTFADSLPAFRSFIVARDRHIWVEPYPSGEELVAAYMNGDTGTVMARQPWSVFDSEGRWLGIVAMPDGLRVTEIGDDYVLGVWTNELDVPFVRLHTIVKNSLDAH